LLIPRIEKRATLFFAQSNPLSVAVTTFPLQDLLWFFWLPYSIGLAYLALGLVIYRLRRADRISRVFVSFCALVSVFLGGLFDQFTLHLLTPVWLIAFPLVGAGLLHLSFVFPAETVL
jgi:Ni,Fe-hydrogenase I cytochrome b subunit